MQFLNLPQIAPPKRCAVIPKSPPSSLCHQVFDLMLLMYAVSLWNSCENQFGTWRPLRWKGKLSSKPPFWVSSQRFSGSAIFRVSFNCVMPWRTWQNPFDRWFGFQLDRPWTLFIQSFLASKNSFPMMTSTVVSAQVLFFWIWISIILQSFKDLCWTPQHFSSQQAHDIHLDVTVSLFVNFATYVFWIPRIPDTCYCYT